ncbi:hypothetical protein ACI48D_05310 [Massilia sp. LXY-6]|uniref:hypothetical protein n=1 Tax=Massilia sp. LXY-6 TaxID=3379823 RepID=UPI003EE409E3
METTLRTTTAGGALGTRAGVATRLDQPRAAGPTAERSETGRATAAAAGPALLRRNAASIGAALQDQVARAQQALDYLDQVQGQLESLKGELTSRLAGSRGAARQQADGQANAKLGAQVRQLAATLASRRKSAGGGVDGDLNFNGKPATQRFRIRGLDLDALRSGGPQSLAFSVGGNGGPQLSVEIGAGMSDDEIAAAVDRAMAPMGVRAGLDGQGGLVFSTPEANWPAIKDSIAISGRGRVSTDEVPAELAPQQWNAGSGDALRASLREVVQALERVRRSRDAASNSLSAATVEMTRVTTPPPAAEQAAQEFATTAANPDYESLLSLTSALVGVSRERVLALLGLR